MSSKTDLILYLADSALIAGHRLSEWTGHGPILEQDIAMTNIALDHVGRSRLLYQYAAEIKGNDTSEDDLAYLRDVSEYKNLLLLEQPNGDFGHTIVKCFLYDAFNLNYFEKLQQSSDQRLKDIATKSYKEILYHYKWSSDWILRLGLGTEESHTRLQKAVDQLWPYVQEPILVASFEENMFQAGVSPDLSELEIEYFAMIKNHLQKAEIRIPELKWYQKGAKTGIHTEHLGYILAEMQFLQRAYPGMQW